MNHFAIIIITTAQLLISAGSLAYPFISFRKMARRMSGLTHLFPKEFYTIEKAAESNLANWLEFPTELGTCPDEINYLEKVAVALGNQANFFCYYVFRFRMN